MASQPPTNTITRSRTSGRPAGCLHLVALGAFKVLRHQGGADDLQDAHAGAEHAAQHLDGEEGIAERGAHAADQEEHHADQAQQLFAHHFHQRAHSQRHRDDDDAGDGDQALDLVWSRSGKFAPITLSELAMPTTPIIRMATV